MTADTMRRSDMLRRLAESVEQLDGPDTLIDIHIHDALHDEESEVPVARVTGSIDAAANLMPEGWCAGVDERTGPNVWAARAKPERGVPAWAFAATEPLARTACALRAIASDLEAKERTHV